MKKKSKKTDKPSNTEKRPIAVSPALPGSRLLANNPLVHVACIVFLSLIVYSNTLSAPFQWDESYFIVNNPIIKDLHYFASPSDAKGFALYSGLINRYIGYLTFALDYRIHGLSVTGYHTVNIAIHIANSILVYLLVLLTFNTPFMSNSLTKQHSRYIALFSSMLFASQPLQTEAVTYVFQRFASLVAFFYLLSLTAYIQSRLSEGRRQRFLYYSIALVSAVLAMKTKENAFTLPLVITLFEFCFFSDSIKKRACYLAPLFLTLTIIPLTLMSQTGTNQLDPGSYGGKEFSQADYLFTQFRVIVTYLRLIFFPVNQDIDYDYPVFKSFFDPLVIMSFVFISALFGLGIYMIKGKELKAKNSSTSYYSPDLRLMGFGILWFFITLSVESSIIPLPMLINEYRVYLPSTGIIICVITGGFMLKKKLSASLQPNSGSLRALRILPAMLVLAIIAFSVSAYLRNELWGDGIRLWEDTARKSPAKARVHFCLANMYKDRNLFDEAMNQYLVAIKLEPDYAEAHNNLGTLYHNHNMPDKAMEQYLIAIKLKPDYAEAHNNLAVIYRDSNMPTEAEAESLITIKLNPDDADAHFILGTIYHILNMPDKAIEHYLIAIKLKPDYAEAHNNLGAVYHSLNIPIKAVEQFLIAIKLNPDYMDAHFNLGLVYYKTGQMENARRELITVLNIKPDSQRAQQLLKTIPSY